MDFDVDNVGNVSNNKFIGDMTFEEWAEVNKDYNYYNKIKQIHDKMPGWTYEEIMNYCFDMGINNIHSNESYIKEFGFDHPNQEEFNPMMQRFYRAVKEFDTLRDVEASDELGHGITVSAYLDGNTIGTMIDRTTYETLSYLSQREWMGCRTISSILRHMLSWGLLTANELEYVTTHAVSGQQNNLRSIAFDVKQSKTKESFDYINGALSTLNIGIESAMESDFERDNCVSEIAQEFFDYFNWMMCRPISGINSTDFRKFISKNVYLRRALYNLRDEGYVDDNYVNIIRKEGRIPPEIVQASLEKYHLVEYVSTRDGRRCCVCGANKTYSYKGKAQWYKFIDSNDEWDGRSYMCKPCYKDGLKNKSYRGENDSYINTL